MQKVISKFTKKINCKVYDTNPINYAKTLRTPAK